MVKFHVGIELDNALWNEYYHSDADDNSYDKWILKKINIPGTTLVLDAEILKKIRFRSKKDLTLFYLKFGQLINAHQPECA